MDNRQNSGVKLFFLILVSLFAALMVVLTIVYVTKTRAPENITFGGSYEASTRSFDIDELDKIDEIEIYAGSANIKLYVEDSGKLDLIYKRPGKTSGSNEISADISAGSLTVILPNENNIDAFFDSLNRFFSEGVFSPPDGNVLEIYIPSSYAGSLDIDASSGYIRVYDALALNTVVLKSSSGNVRVDGDIVARNAGLSVSSGSITVGGNLICDETILRSASGSISVTGSVITDSFDADLTSGRINLNQLTAGSISLNHHSGLTNIKELKASGRIESSSGEITIGRLIPVGKLDIRCSSGRVSVGMDSGADVSVYTETSSGRVNNEFKDHNGSFDLNIRTSSGRINVTKI